MLGRVDLELANVWLSDHYFRVAEDVFGFGLDVTEGATYGQSAREDAVWAEDNLGVLGLSEHRGILVDLASVLEDSFDFDRVGRLVVIRESEHLLASIDRHDSA